MRIGVVIPEGSFWGRGGLLPEFYGNQIAIYLLGRIMW